MNCLTLFSDVLLRPVDAFSTSVITAGSMPKRLAICNASTGAPRAAAGTQVFHALAHRVEHRLAARQHLGLAADENRQRAVLRALDAARHRCIQIRETLRFQ